MNLQHLTAGVALLAGAALASAQGFPSPPPQNVLQLSATGTVETQQDLLSLSLTTTREGTDANAVQAQLKTDLEAALSEARKTAQAGQMDVRTGAFGLYPRHGRDHKISGWTGSAELVLEGRDFGRITQAASRIHTLTVGSVGFGLSREQRARVEGEAQAIAIDRYKAKAAELAKSFGFSGYSLREVSVQANDQGMPRPMRRMTAEAGAESAMMAVPVEAGKSTVMVTVSGSVQLR